MIKHRGNTVLFHIVLDMTLKLFKQNYLLRLQT